MEGILSTLCENNLVETVSFCFLKSRLFIKSSGLRMVFLSKADLRSEFALNWREHYALDFFKSKGFERRQCVKCKRGFWSLAERKTCGDASCEDYSFIGTKVARKRFDMIDTWREMDSFFRKNGHASVKRYNVICRWRDDLYFTIASITDFQRWQDGRITFEYPTDKLVVPQFCLRFGDI